ncbi:DoxX family protein [Cyclobacterium plantarum]|uniref:DoxX family membrane protein n=1 Tax=Cyclobacterium plantarum TaxID=2716263 RepID=A0ABX0H7R2_9BACT|nr:DoxX family protein [Cyclobacterium plantarum]NHE56516.1 DoxX family membrane protein [Cyclobacterium plantarum]
MKNKMLLIISLLFGLIFINSGLNKFFYYMPIPEDLPEKVLQTMEAFNSIGWLNPLVGVVEILGGLFFIPKKSRALGAILIFPVMVGIIVHHLVVAPSGLAVPLVLFGILLWVIVENRERYLPMVR